ncbi:uncharacterized protein LOC121874507 [Homarus americanus]|uniref:uncharacterized protein LOC121874507 n=1 Tax=Homarus americanus TaxID=6706 RepID=UPI001C43CC5C|nr:uncharacterized protein LOC121874507 [Homarus americanus]
MPEVEGARITVRGQSAEVMGARRSRGARGRAKAVSKVPGGQGCRGGQGAKRSRCQKVEGARRSKRRSRVPGGQGAGGRGCQEAKQKVEVPGGRGCQEVEVGAAARGRGAREVEGARRSRVPEVQECQEVSGCQEVKGVRRSRVPEVTGVGGQRYQEVKDARRSRDQECEESAGTSRPWQADEGPSISEDLLHDDDDDDDHLPLTSQHRDLRQWVEVREEEEEEEGGEEGGGDTMASDHALYAPKPAYDQLDQYRSPKRSGEEKLRRTGLTTISPQAGVSSESDDSDVERSARPIRRTRPPHLHHHHLLLPRRSDPEVTPLSPPPSLVNAEEEEDSPMKDEEDEEEDPLLPSTPESSSSITSAEIFSRMTQGATSGSTDSNGSTSRLLVISQNTDDTLNASSVPTIPVTPSPLTSPSPSVSPTIPQVEPFASTPTSAITPAAATTTGASTSSVNTTEPIVGRSERSKSCAAVFPSLQDHLRAAGLSRDDPVPNENLSAQEIESKFTQLSLAFKTDRLTLRQRLDVQQRQRDTAETNFDTEIDQLRSSVLALHADCLDTELIDAVTQVRRHLDILATSSTRLVYASEVWGAVQQEWRVSRALEVLLLHVENVKRMYERDHQELEEMRRVLNEYQIELPVSPGASGALSQSSSDYTAASRRVRALSLAGCTNKSQDNRRISLSSGLTKSQPNSYLTSSRGSRRRASLMPDLKPFQEKFAALAATAAAAAAAAAATTTAPAAASSSSTNSSTTSTSKDNTEENGQPPTGVYSSITEEGSESGEEGQDSPSSTTNKNPSINSSIINSLAQLHPDLYAVEPSLQNGDRRLSEESNLSSASQSTAPDAPLPSATPTPIPNPQPQHWLMVALEGVIGWARGGQWPYSPQQTVQGARYAFTSLLLLLAAFFLLLTISSGDSSVLQPYHPGWTTIHHVLHPFVTVRFLGPPPT